MRILVASTLWVVLVVAPSVSAQLDESQVASAIAEAKANYEDRLLKAMINGAQSKARRFINKSTPESEQMGKTYAIYLDALNILTEKYEMELSEAKLSLKNSLLQQDCPISRVACSPNEKYRRINGTCNNIVNGLWGSTYYGLARELPPDYLDGKDEPRGGRENSILPAPRTVSLFVHKSTGDEENTEVTHMVAQFGQFLDHDISLTPEGGKSCCRGGVLDPECWGIKIKSDDEFYQDKNVSCLEYTRSTPICNGDVGIEHREQMNIITAFIDGSNVYGSDDRLTIMLRTHSNGELVQNKEFDNGFLPWASDVDPSISLSGTIIAGDKRANEMPGLTVMHTLFLKEHNRIAREFASKTNWSDEQIFQETRRIVGAELQQITYQEYLPVTLGPDAMTKYNLSLLGNSTSTYNPEVNPTIINSFATAAYRFGHTLVNGLIKMMSGDQVDGQYNVRDNYFIPDQIINRTTGEMPGYNKILNGLIRQAAQKSDSMFSEDLTNYLFKTINNFGSDLAARNIQRGRDNGIPGFNLFRSQVCGFSNLTDWNTKPDDINDETWEKLKLAYGAGSVNDIDLYTGGLSEISLSGAQAGPTFVCLMATQFNRLKFGDRFFFTHANQVGSFSSDQLAQLRGRTLGDIICENSQLYETAKDVFKTISNENPLITCDSATRTKLDISIFAGIKSGSGSGSICMANSATVIILSCFGIIIKFIYSQ